MSAKELKDKLKALRSEFGKPITKMTADEMTKEIAHHETAKKATEVKAKRLEALAKAREAKKVPAPAPRVKKVVEKYPEVSSDEEVVAKVAKVKKVAKKGSETISDRIAKKSERSDE